MSWIGRSWAPYERCLVGWKVRPVGDGIRANDVSLIKILRSFNIFWIGLGVDGKFDRDRRATSVIGHNGR